jgi:hypothetical protein
METKKKISYIYLTKSYSLKGGGELANVLNPRIGGLE